MNCKGEDCLHSVKKKTFENEMGRACIMHWVDMHI